MTTRKGSARISDIPSEILAALNRGEIETRSLPECLAIDFQQLLRAVVPDISDEHVATLLPTDGIMRRTAMAGQLLARHTKARELTRLLGHPSDTVRGWVAFAIASRPKLSLSEYLDRVQPLADDSHFGVRETAWLAVRPHIAADLRGAIKQLKTWTKSSSANIRRFASESTRPRGVWCAHITRLKEQPELGLPILELLKSDESRYVQDSVANWLNDAAKSQPDWVRQLCRHWQVKSPTPQTQRICHRARRSLR